LQCKVPELAHSSFCVLLISSSLVEQLAREEPPAEQPTKNYVINLKTAKALDLEISPALLARADEVIE
jgi:hypothetical protein